MINIIIADDHQIFIDGIKTVLKDVPDITIIGEALNGKQVLHLLKIKLPDVVLLDIVMPELDGLETAQIMKAEYPDVRTIILSNYNDPGFINKAQKYACSGYLLKDCGKTELVNAIKTVFGGGIYFNPKNKKKYNKKQTNIILSKKEKEILHLISKENCSRKIAEKLNISINTVRTHRERIMLKAGVKNTAGLMYWAMKNNLME